MTTALYALLGLLVGAFLNLCADELPRWRRLRRLPFCPHCDEPYPRWAWLSTLAYVRLKPHCPHCGVPIPLRRLVVEVGTAAFFAYLWLRYGLGGQPVLLFLFTVYAAVFVLVVVVDLEHRLILNVVMYPAWAFALLGSFLRPEPYFYRLALLGWLVGFGSLFLVYLGGVLFVRVLSKARDKPINAVAFGFGDVRLGGFIGLALGFPDVITAIFLAVLLGGVVGMLYWFVRAVILRRYSLFTAIPYGPFLVLGSAAVLFFIP
jgi:leader peptidase (prepilin peptidase)/N-methyltransferase